VARFVTDPTIKAVQVDVRTPPAREDEEWLPDPDDVGEDDFAWRHNDALSARVAEMLEGAFPRVTAGHVNV
jgi:hypothetical protein